MADPRNRSVHENQLEMARLRKMYDRLPPDKKASAHAHMQKRMNELQSAIAGTGGRPAKSGGSDFSTLQMALLVVLFGIVAIGVGFFGVTYLVQPG